MEHYLTAPIMYSDPCLLINILKASARKLNNRCQIYRLELVILHLNNMVHILINYQGLLI